MRICIVGDPLDLSSVYLGWLAQRRGIDVINLSEETLGIDWAFRIADSSKSEGSIKVGNIDYSFCDLHGAFVRLNPQPALPPGLNLPFVEQELFISERRSALQLLLNNAFLGVANRPSAGRSNGSKPFQMRLLVKAGFEVPEWIVTNELLVAREFAQKYRHGVIYKACSGLRSRVRMFDEGLVRRLVNGTSPVVIQEYIQGRDVRVHVVQHRAFATEIRSEGIDYRFDNTRNEFCVTSVPERLEQQCYTFAESEGLVLAGFDFRVTDDGRWYCLEVNPMPTFLPYEIATGQAIGDALLLALTRS